MNDKNQEEKMWKIEGEACAEISQLVNDAEETAMFLQKGVDAARQKLKDHLDASNKKIWDRIHSEIGVKDGHGLRLNVDTTTAKTGVIIVREHERCNHVFGGLLGHILGIQ